MDELDPTVQWHRIDEAGGMGLHFVEEQKLKAVRVNGQIICLARKGDQIFAIKNRCPHGGGPLDQGFLNAEGHVVCPWHRFPFCLEDGKSPGGEGYSTEVFPVEIQPDGMYIAFPRRKRWLGIF